MSSLLGELKRRGVSKAVATYAVTAWLLIQIIVSVEAPLGLPSWSDTFVIIAVILGFPVCVALTWFYDFTSHGIELTADPDGTREVTPPSWGDRATMLAAIGASAALVLTAAYFLIGQPGRSIDSVAISPFTLVDTDEATQYLGESMRDSLVRRLSNVQGLRLKSLTAGASEGDLTTLGDLLDVDAICRGRVVQRANSLSIAAELLDADDGTVLWSGEYSSELFDVLSIEAEIALRIAERLGLELTQDEQTALSRGPTQNPIANRNYQQGRFYWNRRTPDGFAKSLTYYTNAIDVDPGFALAHAGLADTYLMILGWALEPAESVAPLVEQAANAAIRFDPNLPQPYAALGYLKTIQASDWEEARSDFLRAIELDSNYSSAHHWYAFLLMTLGNMRAAIEEIELARDLEPLSPIINAEVGYFYLFDRQYERALEELEAALALDRNYSSTLSYLMRANILLGRRDEALAAYERWRVVAADNLFATTYGAMALPLMGLREEAQLIFQKAVAAREDM